MHTFIRVVEVWRPSVDGTLLELADGLFESAPAFGAQSRGLCFGRGEGLPGRAWEEARPLLLRRLEGSYFRRVAAAQAAGLVCAAALPVFGPAGLSSVVVMLCGDSGSHSGAIELWHNDPRVTGDLTLQDGYFGSSGEALESLSRDSYLPRGAGLPGMAWQREAAVFIDGLGESHQFLRAQTAASAGIVRGLALPCGTPSQQTWVLSLLSSSVTPIARRVESWLPGEAGASRLQRGFGHCEASGPLPTGPETAVEPAELGIVGAAWSGASAQVGRGAGRLGSALDAELGGAGLSTALAIPLAGDGVVGEVVVLHF
ncbi:MAG: hypothetical protein KF788_05245 [Piscinibacter sp.]|nr:hypothetical protein [Piscinibacter sp.]